MNCAKNSMMETEINSQGQIIDELIKKYIVNYCILINIPLLISKVTIVASGSSYNAGLFGKYFFENFANTQTTVDFASEFCSNKLNDFNSDANASNLYIFISQSGESKDTVAALKKVKEKGAKTLCITNNINSTMYALSDYKIDIEAGREQAIAATKTFSATVTMLYLLALKAAQNKHIDISDETKNIYQTAHFVKAALNDTDNLNYASKLISKQKEFSIAGFGLNYPLAREAALKIKETSYINTSSYPTGEFIHGHFALLNKSKVFLTFMTGIVSQTEKELLDKIIRTYHPKTIIITDEYEDYNSDILVKFPKTESKLATILSSVIVVQLLALKTAQQLGRDVDKPKGLNKIVKDKETKQKPKETK